MGGVGGLNSHGERLLPFGAVGVVALLGFLGLAVDRHLHVRTGTEPVFLVLLQFC